MTTEYSKLSTHSKREYSPDLFKYYEIVLNNYKSFNMKIFYYHEVINFILELITISLHMTCAVTFQPVRP